MKFVWAGREKRWVVNVWKRLVCDVGTMELQLRFAYDYPRATPAYSIVLP